MEHVGAAEEAAAALEEVAEVASKPTPSDTETLTPLSEEVGAADELLQVEVGVLLLEELQVELLEELEEELLLPSAQKEIKRPTLSVCNGNGEHQLCDERLERKHVPRTRPEPGCHPT